MYIDIEKPETFATTGIVFEVLLDGEKQAMVKAAHEEEGWIEVLDIPLEQWAPGIFPFASGSIKRKRLFGKVQLRRVA
jgi:hypothetical protein